MRFQVPQFVDIEDRVIGPLTLKMFGYYALAGTLLIPLYLLVDLALFITMALPILGTAALFAHVKLQGQSLVAVLGYAVRFFASPRIYIWRRGGKPFLMVIHGSEYEDLSGAVKAAAPLDSIAQMLNAQGNVSAQDAADPLVEEEAVATEGENNPEAIGEDTTSVSPGDQPLAA
jgi:hypothetical protein